MTPKEKLDILKKYDEQDPHETFMTIADDYAIEFSNWVDNLKPSQRVSLWSKDGSYRGIFNMDKEQLLEQFKKEKGL